jgi:hypothetical protein
MSGDDAVSVRPSVRPSLSQTPQLLILVREQDYNRSREIALHYTTLIRVTDVQTNLSATPCSSETSRRFGETTPPSSGSKSELRKKKAEAGAKLSLLDAYLFGFILRP